MIDIQDSDGQQSYWSQRYTEERTGWDIGATSTPLQSYVDQLKRKDLKILIPGAGNAYEAEYFFRQGHTQVTILDIAREPLDAFKKRVPDFPEAQIMLGNFFDHEGSYDLILEQTFFCSFPPTQSNRNAYARKMHELLAPGGKLVGLWFDFPLKGDLEKRPFGGTLQEYLGYLNPYFHTHVFERCYNSIPERQGNELFGIFKKK